MVIQVKSIKMWTQEFSYFRDFLLNANICHNLKINVLSSMKQTSEVTIIIFIPEAALCP